MKKLDYFGLFGLLISAVIVAKAQFPNDFEYETSDNNFQVVNNPNQDMGNIDYQLPPDFNSNPFPNPNEDPFSRQNQVRRYIFW